MRVRCVHRVDCGLMINYHVGHILIGKRGARMPTSRRLRCAVCKELFSGYGNRAEPVAEGLCCDACDNDIVMPTRSRQMFLD